MKQIFKWIIAAIIAIILPLTAAMVSTGGQRAESGAYEDEILALSPEEAEEITEGETAHDPQEGEEAPPEETPVKNQKIYIEAKVNSLNVRSAPSSSAQSLGQLDKGDRVVLVKKGEAWHETLYRGKTAYVSAGGSYTVLRTSETASDEIEKVIAVGEKYLGTPYVYGAVRLHDGGGKLLKNFTVAKFDCSSLMQYMFYYGAGINLNTTTRTQVKQGVKVAKASLKRGDLIFFTNSSRYYNTGVERIGHVAIYLGDNYILHTASDHAVIEKISSTRWSYYIEARRIID